MACRVLGTAACLVSALFFLCGTGYAAQELRVIEYIYVEANEGDSSGGHTAIRFDQQTFHFQHENPGIIRIMRLDSAAFNHMYAKLGNRTIRESMIAVSGETYSLLQDALTRLYLIQDAQLALRDDLRRDISLFELLLQRYRAVDRQTTEIPFPIKGLGYFIPHGQKNEIVLEKNEGGIVTDPQTLFLLRDKILATYGERFIEERIIRARTRIKELALRAVEPSSVANISRDAYPGHHSNPSTRFYDALSALSALEQLQAAPPLLQGTFWSSDSNAFRLEPQEALALKSFADRQEENLVSLVNSSRPDWGFPFMVGMARLAATKASLQSGQLVFLNIYSHTDIVQESRFDNDREKLEHATDIYIPAMNNDRQKAFHHWRMEFFKSGSLREADYAALERSGNLLIDIEQAVATGTLPRKIPEASFPSCEGLRSDVPLPDMDEAAVRGELESARIAAKNYDAALKQLYSYNLCRRNCVTEIFAVFNSALKQNAIAGGPTSENLDARAIMESNKRLGGFIDASGGFTFIPFVSADKVEASYTVVAVREQPSYRRERVMEMAKNESPLIVFFRESNTISSTIYHPTPEDSSFLFFTDDAFILRPLFGACNILVGLGGSLHGLAVMPFKGPDSLLSGVKGVMFSLPELAFVNIRKGSMAYVEQSNQVK